MGMRDGGGQTRGWGMVPWGWETSMGAGRGLERWVVWLGVDDESCISLVKGSGHGAGPARVQIPRLPGAHYEILDK